ncbi:hypothetical protein pipiens_004113 [Culex pipiens pipiens]|uniref:BTB domain-containing protein n=1 Tax=Culex pipiens pipiens TaxID=38569 RepID=A0ABD1CNA2_CULPP
MIHVYEYSVECTEVTTSSVTRHDTDTSVCYGVSTERSLCLENIFLSGFNLPTEQQKNFNHGIDRNQRRRDVRHFREENRVPLHLGHQQLQRLAGKRRRETVLAPISFRKFGDVTILVAGQRFPAHKCILSARSSVFSAMFEHPMQETIENCVSIDDVEPPVIEALLGFIYTDELTSLETMAHALYKAADKYDVPTLKSHCRCHILEKLSWETAAETLMLADLYGDLEMKKHVLQFLSVSVAAKVTETDGWKEMVRACPHLVDETIRAMAAKGGC